jgi:hypothetical protein
MQSSRHHIEAGQIDSNLVLVVDDSRLQRSILRASLKKWAIAWLRSLAVMRLWTSARTNSLTL